MASPSTKPSTKLDYFVVDVFTETPLAGNPLAVVMNTASLTTEQMQAIAREFNLSETTFIERRPAEVERREGVRVRIFTTQEELPFAGHPSLGTASWLHLNHPPLRGATDLKLLLNVGPILIRIQPGGDDAGFATMWQEDAGFGGVYDRGEGGGGVG